MFLSFLRSNANEINKFMKIYFAPESKGKITLKGRSNYTCMVASKLISGQHEEKAEKKGRKIGRYVN